MDVAALTIRAQEPEDAERLSALVGLPGVYEGTLQLPDMPIASRLEFLRRADPASCRLVALAGEELVGAAGLHPVGFTARRQHARVLGISIAPPWQGRGVGRELLTRLLEWADNWGAVLRVELMVHADNERAQALYRRMGFVEEGRFRGYALRNGRYIDSLAMARLHPDPPRLAG